MGQSSSRQRAQATRRQQSVSSPTQPHPSPLQQVETPSGHVPNGTSTSEAAPTAKSPQRSSLRRSVLSLFPHASSSSSARSRPASYAPQTEASTSLRKRWRLSRRSSKTKTPSTELPMSTPSGDCMVAESGTRGESDSSIAVDHSPGSNTARSAPPSSTSQPILAQQEVEGPAREESLRRPSTSPNIETQADRAVSPSNSSIQPEVDHPRPVHPTPEDIEREVSEFLNGHPNIARRSHDTGTGPTISNTVPDFVLPPSDPSSLQPAPQRHFPPPGTLVVVQGVVNTTDTPHNSSTQAPGPSATPSASSPQPTPGLQQTPPLVRRRSMSTPYSYRPGEDRQNGRNRLSSLMRPTSMLGGRPSSSGPQISTSSSSGSDVASTPDVLSRSETVPSDASNSTPNAEGQDAATSQQRGLSPGSIDVLGTLLSVAAAATAASLFSPGLPFNGNGGAGASGMGPLSPAPGPGLGGLAGLGGLPGLGLNPSPSVTSPLADASQTDRDSRDRIRNVWDTIRERVGLNNRPSGPGMPEPTDENPSVDRNARMRPGELMLAEMARALNAGLGLTGTSESRPSDATNAPGTLPSSQSPLSSSSDTSLPPENSFERFLINLQADLRTVLSEDAPARVASSDVPSSSSQAVPNTAGAVPSSTIEAPSSVIQPEIGLADDEPPPLADLSDDSDADSDNLEDELLRSSSGPRSVPRTPTPIPPASGIPYGPQRTPLENPPMRSDRRQPAINLWRLYRFQPISTPRSSDLSARDSRVPLGGGISTFGSPLNTESSSTRTADSRPLDQQSQNHTGGDTNMNTIVPVIVVGLQSVDVARDEPDDEPDAQGVDPEDTQAPNPLGVASPYGAPRGRTWHSRAASALRTFRPGRRGSSRGRRTNDGSGSRTFLIYVIGGYYPPNHHMVTGAENLDSYEALWELAELLGQVKPPTATKEDIDNSGLQIIKASDLSRFESEGKVSSNCVERCLVCLDDYSPDDELRLMSCRHTFHKDCVDKWLQVGRNNCPACRTKGVSVTNDVPPPQTSN